MTILLSTPAGTYGLAVAPWDASEVYAVAAEWSQAGALLWVYGQLGWVLDECGRQVADFRHRPRHALEAIIQEAANDGGEELADDDIARILDAAEDIDDETEEADKS